jgi:peptidoglycan/xylan/chitin deacetylase (PgdA/CDA1 family)
VKEFAGFAAGWIAGSGLLSALEWADRSTSRVRILAYHRVDEIDPDDDLDPGLISATPEDFEAQVRIVAERYSPISLDALVASHRGEATLPPRAVLMTFDDGYEDFARNAWPIMKRHGVPAVLFVPTSFPDSEGPGFWWDRLWAALVRTEESCLEVVGLGRLELGHYDLRRRAHKVLRTHAKTLPHAEALRWLEGIIDRLAAIPSLHRVLGWDALRTLASEGVAVCSHSHLHALCNRLEPAELAEDLALAKARIESELGAFAPPPVFAYPSSASDPGVHRAVADAGYELGFGGQRGVACLPFADPMNLMRMPAHRYSPALFRAGLRPSVSRIGGWLVDG